MDSPNTRYIPAVDHLRLYAALMVLMWHGVLIYDTTRTPVHDVAHAPALLILEGQGGVSLFMVLSGFILTYAALGRRVAYGAFLRNRALRILPLLAILFLFTATARPDRLGPQMAWIVVAPTQEAQLGGFFRVAWTIFVEIQLYLLFPVLVHHLEEGGPRRLLSLIALLAGLRFAALGTGTSSYGILYLSVFSRADQFLLGMLAAWLLRRYPIRAWAALAPLGMVLSLLILAAFDRAGGIEQAGGTALGHQWAALSPTVEGVGWACVVLGYVTLMRGASSSLSRILARVGATSYSIYLWHLVVLVAMRDHHIRLNVGGGPFVRAVATLGLVAVPLALATAWLSYTLIEQPFLRRRVRWAEEPREVRPAVLHPPVAS